MKQKSTSSRQNFLQRRYGVRLGRRYALAAASVVLMSVIGCSSLNRDNSAAAESQQPHAELPISKKSVNPDTKIVAANTKFGFKLFSEVLKSDPSKNVFVSPSSVAFALAMTYNGASGSTQQEMAKALELQGLTLQQINSSNAALKALLENPDPKVQLAIANSLWANQNASFNPDFLQRNRDFYQAKIANLNFTDAQAPGTINDWVKQNTGGKIEKIVQKINPDQALFLVNAIYFKGSWTNEFDKQETREYPFLLASGQQKQHPMMSQKGKYKYLENQEFQAVNLPYGNNGRISLYVFLPKQNSNLKAFSQTLKAENWDKWMSQFSKREGSIRLPKFKIDYDITLNNTLKALGMGQAFSSKANFSGMGNGKNLAISEVKHKTFVEVNEQGTEAAAATSVGIMPLSASIPTYAPFQMIVDRPFFCAIRDNQTGSIVFMGSIAEPLS
jgi:serine protease inhibitor